MRGRSPGAIQLESRCAGPTRPLVATLLNVLFDSQRSSRSGQQSGPKVGRLFCYSTSTCCNLEALSLTTAFHGGSSETSPTAAAPPRPITMETAYTQFPFPFYPVRNRGPSDGTGARLGGCPPGSGTGAHEHQGPKKIGRGQSEVLRSTPRGGEAPVLYTGLVGSNPNSRIDPRFIFFFSFSLSPSQLLPTLYFL